MASTPRSSTPRRRTYVPLTKRVKDPAGRLDWLSVSLLERVVQQRNNPVLTQAFEVLRPAIEQHAVRVLGPNTAGMRKTRKLFLEIIEQAKRQGVTL